MSVDVDAAVPQPGQLDEVVALFASSDVEAFAKSRLTSYGFKGSYAPEDLLGTAFEKVFTRLMKIGPIGDGEPDAVRRYVFRTVRNCAIDLLRARENQPKNVDVIGGDISAMDNVPVPENEMPIASTEAWDRARAVAKASMSVRSPWLTAAVLAHLALDQEPDPPLPSRLKVPQDPAHGQVTQWAALQYAGRDNCFVEPDTAAVRKRRSDAMIRERDEMKAVLTKAWELGDRFRS